MASSGDGRRAAEHLRAVVSAKRPERREEKQREGRGEAWLYRRRR
jgi:hypothetical protein